MQERLKAYDARRWATHFLSSLTKVKAQQGQLATRQVTRAIEDEVTETYRKSQRALIFLDYDGTLVPFANQPNLAVPDPELVGILGRLVEEPKNRVYLISGRDRATLSTWFGNANLNIIAEHGAWIREQGGDWRMLKAFGGEWKSRIAPILRTYVDQVAGSLIEEKEFSLAWHYRRCDPELGAQRAKELMDDLTHYTANFDVQVIEGKKVVEVRNSGVNKGAAAMQVCAALPHDFTLAIGDDQTDEDLFRALPPETISIRVGKPFSHARYSLNDHRGVRKLLAHLVEPSTS
jgi:trehalose 6-phosphate synthase/phosphatase